MTGRRQVTVAGRSLSVSNLDKVLYPATGTTKAEVLRYYLAVAEAMLPHLRGRPVTFRRFPDGVEGEGFYEKRCPDHRPPWVHTIPLGREGRDEAIEHCELAGPADLAWAANLGALELHVPMGRAPDPREPSTVVFDLDPGAPADVIDCARLAMRLTELLDRLGVLGVPKTSGGKGLQVYVPINVPGTSYATTRAFSLSVARLLERATPELVVTTQTKAARRGKVLVDWSQNHLTKTTVCAYSLRARPEPTVSTPLTWDEIDDAATARDADALRFDLDQVRARVDAGGDRFAKVVTHRQELPALG